MKQNEFPYYSKFLDVYHSSMYYLEAGEGPVVLFLHGNPASSFIWRNIIPEVKRYGRCIAPDLIGMGNSGKPRIDYTFEDHYQYLKEFIDKLGLSEITLVLHDWGSALGFHYFKENPDNIRRIVFMESFIRPWDSVEMQWVHRMGFKMLRTKVLGEFLIFGLNVFLNFILPSLIVRKLEKEEKRIYKKPFRNIFNRKPMLRWIREVPIDGVPSKMYDIVKQYSLFLRRSSIPKLLLYAEPGAIINKDTRRWCEAHIKNLTTVYLGKGYHFLQEDFPLKIGEDILHWLESAEE